MHKNTFLFGTHISRLPKVSGKACAQHVASMWAGRGQKSAVTHTPQTNHNELCVNEQYYPALYTICIQLFQRLVGNITSVNFEFCTVSTGPTKTTTTYINRRGTV